MSLPPLDDVRRLVEWRPPLGVVSVYLRVDPDDRGGAWRTELGNSLSALEQRSHELDHETAAALRATCVRIADRFTNHERSLPRGQVGFVEVASKPAVERWWSSHLAPPTPVTAKRDDRPIVAPLVCLLDRDTTRGVALLSSERVRLLEWAPGRLEQLDSWELSIFSGDWRERKAQRVPNPARAQAVSASGRDQFDERLEENRRRFLGECGRLASHSAKERRWRDLLAFGGVEVFREFADAAASRGVAVEHVGEGDLISEPGGRVESAISEAAAELDAERERELVQRALDTVRGGMRGAAGPQETEAALGEARVETLVLDAARAARSEPLVRAVLESGGRVRAVSGEAAEPLSSIDGVAALLRY